MDKESIYELQKIDCNCNDCKFMERDFVTYKKWEEWHRSLAYQEFEASKKLLQIRKDAQFIFDKSNLMQYGVCSNPTALTFNKSISFIPNVCQIETHGCFKHRR